MLVPRRTSTLAMRLVSSTAADVILSSENRARCLKCLHALPPLGLRPGKSKPDASFASVLISVCIDNAGETSILYTRRSGQLSRHVRQVSFPGGIKDPEDASFEDCALRETEEEIGLSKSRVEIWGSGPLITPPHTAAIMPVYGTIRNFNLSELTLNEAEVEEAFTVPISHLAAPTTFRHTQFKSGYSAPAFVVDNHRIWGITGFLTNNFVHCLLPSEASVKMPKMKYVTPFRAKLVKSIVFSVLRIRKSLRGN